jgi:general secretion pathway protein C
MKRWPLVASFLLFIAVCASAAYWAMDLFQPPPRPVAAPPRVAASDVRVEDATGLFGGRAGKVAVASNYQLRGVIFSGRGPESVAILSANGKPAQAIRVNAEVLPGVTVKEVHRDHVLLSEGGVSKRVELPEDARAQGSLATVAPTATQSVPTGRIPTEPGVAPVSPTQKVPAAPPPTVVNPTDSNESAPSVTRPEAQAGQGGAQPQ